MSTLHHDDGTPVSDRLARILADVAAHPDTPAHEIARRIGGNAHDIFRALDHAAYSGLCQRSREGSGAWLWEVPPPTPVHLRSPAGGNWTKCGHGGRVFAAPITDELAEATCKDCLREAGVSEPVVVAEIKTSSEGEG